MTPKKMIIIDFSGIICNIDGGSIANVCQWDIAPIYIVKLLYASTWGKRVGIQCLSYSRILAIAFQAVREPLKEFWRAKRVAFMIKACLEDFKIVHSWRVANSG